MSKLLNKDFQALPRNCRASAASHGAGLGGTDKSKLARFYPNSAEFQPMF
jgi:hypothetical protein